ncbi:MAG: serine/threonine protein kinase [Sphaerospermopsis kisseleviana]
MVFYPGQALFGGRYIIQRELGQGGIGITYLAKNQRGELRVIKTLRQEILNRPDLIQHQNKLKQDFRDEGLRLALCRHPHIVEVENVFDEASLPCMVMEYINGEDLGKRITEKGALSEAEALLYIQQIGDALTVVHEKGLLHRDLKPNNIMIRAGKQEAVLIDFGIARQFVSGEVQQHTQNLTPGYSPPEQYLPDAERGEYIDVYALAATLYALLTGQLPMPAPARLQNFTLKPVKDFNFGISDKVNDGIMKGMALNYKFRPQSIIEWLNLLFDNFPVSSSPQLAEYLEHSHIIIIGTRPSGKITYLATLAYLNNLVKTNSSYSVECLNEESQELAEEAKFILAEGEMLSPTSLQRAEIYYSFLIKINNSLRKLNQNNVQVSCSFNMYPGCFFSELIRSYKLSDSDYYWSYKLSDSDWFNSCIEKLTETKYLALIIDSTAINDIEIAHSLTVLERILNLKIYQNDQPQYRIAVMFSHFDLPEVYPYKNNLHQFVDLKFPHTKLALQIWSNNWNCAVAYFAYSAFGMIGDTSQANCQGRYQGIKNPKIWKPFGLIAPIYWLLTGRYDQTLLELDL